MKGMSILDSTKIKYVLPALFAILALFLFGILVQQFLSDNTQVSECEQLSPVNSPLMLPRERGEVNLPAAELDFREKEQIAYGKYGFCKKLTVEKLTIVSQSVSEDLALKDIHFGIFHDSNLSKPVTEVSMERVLQNEHASELGKPKPYPESFPYIDVALEPGTYYLAVYSTNAHEDCTVLYESRQAAVDTELELVEEQWGFFFSTGPEQKTYFKIYVPAAGTIYVDRDFWRVTYVVQLCDANKRVIQKSTLEPPGTKSGHQKAKLTVPAAGEYYLQISYNSPPSSYPNEVRYNFVQSN